MIPDWEGYYEMQADVAWHRLHGLEYGDPWPEDSRPEDSPGHGAEDN